MRFSFLTLMLLSLMAFAGPVFAQDGTAAAEQAAPQPPVNPMGAGLVVPAGEAASPVGEEGITIYTKPDLASDQVGVLTSRGSTIAFQTHVIVKRGQDPNWKPGFFRRLFRSEAPVVDYQVPVSEFRLSPKQQGIMIVTVEGSWLQIAQGWFQWTQAVANKARFVPWSELYQQASFSAFQLSNARADRADLVPLGEVDFREASGNIVKVKAPARFLLLDAQPGTYRVKLTGGTCKQNPNPLGGEGKEGWVNLFAQNGAPQLLLEPEQCPEEVQH